MLFHFSCNGPGDDEYRPCFECEGFEARKAYGDQFFDPIEHSHTSRQDGNSFQVTRQSRRVICGIGMTGEQICRLRVSRAMQLRGRSYTRAQDFVQSEQYLTQEDIDLIFRYYSSFKWL